MKSYLVDEEQNWDNELMRLMKMMKMKRQGLKVEELTMIGTLNWLNNYRDKYCSKCQDMKCQSQERKKKKETLGEILEI